MWDGTWVAAKDYGSVGKDVATCLQNTSGLNKAHLIRPVLGLRKNISGALDLSRRKPILHLCSVGWESYISVLTSRAAALFATPGEYRPFGQPEDGFHYALEFIPFEDRFELQTEEDVATYLSQQEVDKSSPQDLVVARFSNWTGNVLDLIENLSLHVHIMEFDPPPNIKGESISLRLHAVVGRIYNYLHWARPHEMFSKWNALDILYSLLLCIEDFEPSCSLQDGLQGLPGVPYRETRCNPFPGDLPKCRCSVAFKLGAQKQLSAKEFTEKLREAAIIPDKYLMCIWKFKSRNENDQFVYQILLRIEIKPRECGSDHDGLTRIHLLELKKSSATLGHCIFVTRLSCNDFIGKSMKRYLRKETVEIHNEIGRPGASLKTLEQDMSGQARVSQTELGHAIPLTLRLMGDKTIFAP